MKNRVAGTFRSLRSFNFRFWTAGSLVSNTGTWMQRVAQDWLVLTRLTHHVASALGIVMGLQFAPQLLFLPWTGSAADRLNRAILVMLFLIGTFGLNLPIFSLRWPWMSSTQTHAGSACCYPSWQWALCQGRCLLPEENGQA